MPTPLVDAAMRDLGGTGTGERPARAEQRFAVALPIVLRTRCGRFEGLLLDLSRTGACIEIAKSLTQGGRIILEREGLNVAGQIVWARGGWHGLSFDTPLRAVELLVQMSESRRLAEISSEAPRPASATANGRCPSR